MSAILLQHEVIGQVNVLKLAIPHPMDDERLDQLNTEVNAVLDGRRDQAWILDFVAVPYMGSSMLGWLINLRHQIKTGKGSLTLCGLSPILMDLFRNSSMQRLFVFAKDRKAAMK